LLGVDVLLSLAIILQRCDSLRRFPFEFFDMLCDNSTHLKCWACTACTTCVDAPNVRTFCASMHVHMLKILSTHLPAKYAQTSQVQVAYLSGRLLYLLHQFPCTALWRPLDL
jgi:hypothetical protein